MGKKPNFFIVGHPKCGTTSLYYYLKQHPDIFMSSKKEPNFFSKDFQEEEEKDLRKFQKLFKHSKIPKKYTLKEYLNLFKESKNEKIVGECSTTYLFSKKAALRIKEFNPQSKILIILRKPEDFIISLFQNFQFVRDSSKNLEEAFLLEEKRRQGFPIKVLKPPIYVLIYSEWIKYTQQIKRYLQNFDKKQILILFYEEFKKDNERTLNKIFSFLEVNKIKINKIEKNKSRIIRNKKIKRFLDLNYIKTIKRSLPFQKVLKDLYSKIFFIEGKIKKDVKIKKSMKREVIKINDLLHKEKIIQKNKNLLKIWDYNK